MKYWLLKTEPTTFSYQRLTKEGSTFWDGVRNFQARGFIREIAPGDAVLIYHSGEERAVVGVARVRGKPVPDPDPKKKGDWLKFEVAADKPLKHAVSLSEIRAEKSLAGLLLLKQPRLSVMPLQERDFKTLVKMGSGA